MGAFRAAIAVAVLLAADDPERAQLFDGERFEELLHAVFGIALLMFLPLVEVDLPQLLGCSDHRVLHGAGDLVHAAAWPARVLRWLIVLRKMGSLPPRASTPTASPASPFGH
jgi:hypothetical protein